MNRIPLSPGMSPRGLRSSQTTSHSFLLPVHQGTHYSTGSNQLIPAGNAFSLGSGEVNSSHRRRDQSLENNQRRKDRQEEMRSALEQSNAGAWTVMSNLGNKIAKIDSLLNKYQSEMEYVTASGIQNVLAKNNPFYQQSELPRTHHPSKQRKILPTSFLYIDRQKIREQIQLKTQMQFFHPNQYNKLNQEKSGRTKEDIDYLKLLAKRQKQEEERKKKGQNERDAPTHANKHVTLDLQQMQGKRNALLDEFYAKDHPNKLGKITDLIKQYRADDDPIYDFLKSNAGRQADDMLNS